VTLDVSGRFVVPGFIDAHMHLESVKLMVDEFARLVTQAPGWEQDKVLEEVKSVDLSGVNGITACKVSAAGTFGGIKAVQYFYQVGGPQGDQLVGVDGGPGISGRRGDLRRFEFAHLGFEIAITK